MAVRNFKMCRSASTRTPSTCLTGSTSPCGITVMTNTAKSLRSPPPDSDLILTLDVEKPSDSQLKLGKAVLEFDTYIRVRLLQRAGHAGHVEVPAPTAARGG